MSGENLSFPVMQCHRGSSLIQDINNEKNANKCYSSRRIASSAS